MVVETFTFRLVAGADESAFRAADARMQGEFVHLQPGIIRRTTARGAHDTDDWIVVTLWDSTALAEQADRAAATDPVAVGFIEFVDAGSARTTRYIDVGG